MVSGKTKIWGRDGGEAKGEVLYPGADRIF
jgi:hypothetical protein